MWTVFVGQNGTCKTTLLRAIAAAAAGTAFANNLIREPLAYRDRRREQASPLVDAGFGFSAVQHGTRVYPKVGKPRSAPPELVSRIEFGSTAVRCRANYGRWESRTEDIAAPEIAVEAVASEWASRAARAAAAAAQAAANNDPGGAAHWAAEAALSAAGAKAASGIEVTTPLDDARDQDLPCWFVAAYGTGRILAAPHSVTEGAVPKRDRLRSLFDAAHLPLGTGFSDLLARTKGDARARAFAMCLREALVDHMHTPGLNNIELRGQGGVASQTSLIEAHRFTMQVGSEELKLPAVWLSQGYQAVVSLVADIIGNVWLEANAEVPLRDMEGIVLVDEIDLHLHPTWQTEIVRGLKQAFPRMQFIVTTHSPLVLAGCRADEVWTLAQDESTGDVVATQGRSSPMTMTGSELNRTYFGVARASPRSEDLRRYVELASNPYRSDTEDEVASALLRRLRENAIPVDYEPVARKTAS